MRRLDIVASIIQVMTASCALAQPGALAGEEQVFRELLADGRGARDDAAVLLVLRPRLHDRLPIEAFVVEEARVLGGDHGTLEMHGDALVGNPLVPEPGFRVPCAQRLEALVHEGAGGGW